MLTPENLRPVDPNSPVILVAEDDVMVRNFVRITLEAASYSVLTADDGDRALYMSRQYPGEIRLLITDLRMPKMDGIELSRHVSVERPSIRIALMSGYAFEETLDRRFVLIPKPFSPAQLRVTVDRLLA